jgi:hypothetical protein
MSVAGCQLALTDSMATQELTTRNWQLRTAYVDAEKS